MVVKAGMLAVYSSDNIETGHLIDGDYFGEISLVTDSEVSASEVVAITHCQVRVHYNKISVSLQQQHRPPEYNSTAYVGRPPMSKGLNWRH